MHLRSKLNNPGPQSAPADRPPEPSQSRGRIFPDSSPSAPILDPPAHRASQARKPPLWPASLPSFRALCPIPHFSRFVSPRRSLSRARSTLDVELRRVALRQHARPTVRARPPSLRMPPCRPHRALSAPQPPFSLCILTDGRSLASSQGSCARLRESPGMILSSPVRASRAAYDGMRRVARFAGGAECGRLARGRDAVARPRIGVAGGSRARLLPARVSTLSTPVGAKCKHT